VDIIRAALLGSVQGITEFLPVSSSAHLILSRAFFGWNVEAFGLPFDVACHVGTLLAVLVFFRADLAGMARAVPAALTGQPTPETRRLWLIVIGTIPIVIVGLTLADVIEASMRTPFVAACALLAGAALLLAIERLGGAGRDESALGAGGALLIGIAQSVALIPGVSRSGATIAAGMAVGLRRDVAARFTFLLSIPAILAAAAKEALELRHSTFGASDLTLFAVGHGDVCRGGLRVDQVFDPLPRHTPARRVCLVSRRVGPCDVRLVGRTMTPMASWLRRTFVTGFFVVVPLVVSVVAIVWLVRWADGLTAGWEERLGITLPPGAGLLLSAGIVRAAGVLATNVIGRRLLARGDQLLLNLPLFRAVYAPVKQLITAFSPESEAGFKKMVLVQDPGKGFLLGFLTKEFAVDRGTGPETFLAVYVPTNHLYLGDILVCEPERCLFPDMSVQEGVRVFLTGGMGLPASVRASKDEIRRDA
jgi:undecaprenyl-diphosphatase